MLCWKSPAMCQGTPKRPTSAALGAPPFARMEDSSKAVATFLQASPWVASPDDTVPISHTSPTPPVPETPEVVSIRATPPSRTSTGDSTGTLPKEVLHLQEEMNMIMGQLLTTRAPMDAHQRKEVSDFQTALHQNKAQTTEAIREAEAVHVAAIREAKACCANIIQDAQATMQKPSGRWRPPAQNVAAFWSKLTGIWRAWKGSQLRRRRSETANLY